jgi:hypothetical protein
VGWVNELTVQGSLSSWICALCVNECVKVESIMRVWRCWCCSVAWVRKSLEAAIGVFSTRTVLATDGSQEARLSWPSATMWGPASHS